LPRTEPATADDDVSTSSPPVASAVSDVRRVLSSTAGPGRKEGEFV
jgi:hypothetical protein